MLAKLKNICLFFLLLNFSLTWGEAADTDEEIWRDVPEMKTKYQVHHIGAGRRAEHRDRIVLKIDA